MQPTLTVLKLGSNSQSVLDTKVGILSIVCDIAPGVATNLFKDIAGEIAGTAHYLLPISSNTVKKFNFSVTGHGTDPAGVADSAALLKFKVTTADVFTQAP
jgi:hypothetical protein